MELVDCLKIYDFNDFTTQLEGLSSIYQLNAEPDIKKKAFIALQALESDLTNLFLLQNHADTHAMIFQSAVGVLHKRRCGHPMRLTIFVSPYDLIDVETQQLQSLTLDLVKNNNDIGLSLTVNLEPAPLNKLQLMPIMTSNLEMNGKK